MDCSFPLLKKTFPDSDLAKKFSCARTKTDAIITSVLAPYSIDAALKSFEDNDIEFCAIATDGSNHAGLKLFPVLVQYFDWTNGGMQPKIAFGLVKCKNFSAFRFVLYLSYSHEKATVAMCFGFRRVP